jgi:hypothetical protein
MSGWPPPGDRFVAKREIKARKGTFADLRGILSDKVKSASDEQLRQWVDEARSRALTNIHKRRAHSSRRAEEQQD